MNRAADRHRTYMPELLPEKPVIEPSRKIRPATESLLVAPRVKTVRRKLMLDIVFLAAGAVFLGACVLYALACDNL